MNGKLFKTTVIYLCLFAAIIVVNVPACAAVYTSPDDGGEPDTVYVAGNPDCFPLEYYNTETKTFCGAIPDMLNTVSEKTGISFTYISASPENRQKELSRNNQAELVTALQAEANECKTSELLPVFEIDSDGISKTYCIGFTEIASPELVQKIKAAFSEISENEKMGFLIANSYNNPEIRVKNRTIKIIIIAAASLFALILAGVIIALKKKKNNRSTMIDKQTGVGNAEYYTYAFEQLISRQSKNLYNVIYLATDTEKIAAEYGEKTIAEIDNYAAAHLNSAIASAEYLARVNDGVFVLLIQTSTENECRYKANTVIKSLNGYIREFYPDMDSAFNAGVTRLCEHPDCNAETAFYNAKQGYLAALRSKTPTAITPKSQLAQSRKQEKLRKSIASAVADNEFKVYLQLITENRSGKICGAEMLSRWHNTEYGILRPHEYIDILKETGQIIRHDYNMFSSVCRLLENWSEEPYDRLFLTCNFTRVSLSQNDFSDRITEISSGYKFDRSRLVIEVTEDSVSENSEIVSKNICGCREMGFKIAIDDMGTGFSSFADLYDNEIDLVKIDGEFIASCTSKRRKTMLSDIISLVHNSGAKVLCEGVENLDQANFLDGVNCDMMQGFYFSKILPLSECEKFLRTEKITAESVFKK